MEVNNTTIPSSLSTMTPNVTTSQQSLTGGKPDLAYLTHLKYLRLSTLPTLVIFGTIGNILTLMVIVKRKLQNRNTLYENILISLVVADIGLLIFTMALNVLIMGATKGILGKFICLVLVPLGDTFIPASVLTLLLIAFIRYKVVAHPLLAKSISTRTLIMALGLIWIASWVIAATPFFLWWKFIAVPGSTLSYCSYQAPFKIWKIYYTCIFSCFIVLPLITVWFLFYRIHRQLRGTVMRLSRHLGHVPEQLRERNNQAFRMIILVTVTFTILVPPFFVVMLINLNYVNFKSVAKTVAYEIALILLCLNSAIDPIIYLISNKSFREDMKDFLGKLCPHRLLEMFSCRSENNNKDIRHKDSLSVTKSKRKKSKKVSSHSLTTFSEIVEPSLVPSRTRFTSLDNIFSNDYEMDLRKTGSS